MTRPAGRVRRSSNYHGSGGVESGQEFFEIARVDRGHPDLPPPGPARPGPAREDLARGQPFRRVRTLDVLGHLAGYGQRTQV